MEKVIKVEVTQADIDEATAERKAAKEADDYYWDICTRCPVARAAERVLGEQVTTGGSYLSIRGRAVYDNPPEVEAFVKAWDHDAPVEPFEFEARFSKYYDSPDAI